jgi:two-component system, sensor histidine kinase and response regulator
MQESILVVDDDPSVRKILVDILTQNSYRVLSSSNGREALKILSKEIPDLIISDIVMPEMNGYELLEFIQDSKIYSNISFIFLTGNCSYQEIREGMLKGADDYITKPFKVRELLAAVETRLKKKEFIKERLDEIKENIALSVPHELNTPLFPILGFSEILVENAKSLNSDEIEEMGTKIKFSASRLRRSIEKFILFSSLQNELNGLRKRKTLFANSVKDIESLVNVIAGEESKIKNGVVELKSSIKDSPLKIDESYFAICIKELLENACKFSEPNSKIKVVGKIKDKFYDLTFENDGSGLGADQLNNINIFNKQFNPSVTGSGLGLPIVKKIMEFFGGGIRMESKPQKYTRAIIHIPVGERY